MYYFSYGSNMSIKRMLSRVPSAQKVDIGILEQHQLKFHKVGHTDGSAKCDAYHSGKPQHAIIGVLFEMAVDDKPNLDHAEGLGAGYDEKQVGIRLYNGQVVQAFIYIATHIDATLKPFDWYLQHVIQGARENQLPLDYIRAIEVIESVSDPNVQRRDKELSIYFE